MKTPNTKKDLGKSNLIKYLNPSSLIQTKAYKNKNPMSNIHCRSMQELDLNPSMASHSSISKEHIKSNIHHSSLFSEKQNVSIQNEPVKSKSLSKFIALFQNSNILNTKTGNLQTKNDKNSSLKRKNYNGFCYDLKISANSNVNNKKMHSNRDKQNMSQQVMNNSNQENIASSFRQLNALKTNKSTLVIKRQNPNQIYKDQSSAQEPLLLKMKEVIQEQQIRQKQNFQRIDQLQTKVVELEKIVKFKQSKLATFGHKQSQFQTQIAQFERKIVQLERKIRDLQMRNKERQQKLRLQNSKQTKNTSKQSRQQNLVLKSLKKVINQQLNKIIQLERFQIQNQYLKEKLKRREKLKNCQQSFVQSNSSNIEDSFENQNQEDCHKKDSSNYVPQSLKSCGKQHYNNSLRRKENFRPEEEAVQNNHFKSYFQLQNSPKQIPQQSYIFKHSQTRYNGQSKDYKASNDSEGIAMIKIRQAESSFSHQAILEVTEENEQNQMEYPYEKAHQTAKQTDFEYQDLREQQDSILEEVDQYLLKWRKKS